MCFALEVKVCKIGWHEKITKMITRTEVTTMKMAMIVKGKRARTILKIFKSSLLKEALRVTHLSL
jgi:hypothetical protein